MGTVLIHAGMPKTGSTSIQRWLRTNAGHLRDRHQISYLHVAATGGSVEQFEAYDARANVKTMSWFMTYLTSRIGSAPAEELRTLADGLVAALERGVAEHGTVLLSGEVFASLFVDGDEPFLRALDQLASRHSIRIAYYVRPQHSALEARWRQWGFRSAKSPSDWVGEQARQLRYADTLDQVREIAPAISLEPRPFRADLLPDGNVVLDFARGFLDLTAPPGSTDLLENVGLSLDLANLLRGAPAALIDDVGVNAGGRQLALGRLGRSWCLEESSSAERSRRVLHAYAFNEFEARNKALVVELDWPTEHFVPPPDPEVAASWDLFELDELWRPDTSPTACAYLYAALSDLMSRRDAPTPLAPRPQPADEPGADGR